MKNSIKHIMLKCPQPISHEEESFSILKNSSKKMVLKKLLEGEYGIIEDRYHTGISILADLKKQVFKSKSKSEFKAYRSKRSEFHEASNRLLVPVKQNQIALKKSPEIGWLEKLYPGMDDFILPFPQVQGLNSSWQWYLKGVAYPGLAKRIRPFYGTYFPTRFSHLRLFWNWLKNYSGPKERAIDIGTGCGVLAFQMVSIGFEKVTATDINPNAVISASDTAKDLGFETKTEILHADLFEGIHQQADLIVFNPPWLPAQGEITGLDQAIYYKPELFKRFFEDAAKRLKSGGKLVLLFSNLAQKEDLTGSHPVEKELAESNRFIKREFIRNKAEKPSGKTKRRNSRVNEFVELWVLEPSQ